MSKCTCGLAPYCDLHFGITKIVNDVFGKPHVMAYVKCTNCSDEFWAPQGWALENRDRIACDLCYESARMDRRTGGDVSKPKHTPGPLFVKEKPLGFLDIVSERQGPLARVDLGNCEPGFSEGEAKANATLFAAAPDLLEALKACRETLKRHYDETEERIGRPAKWKWGENGTVSHLIETAIAKAEGEE